MPSSYTTSLRLTLPATGELAGQWGQTVNTGITELLDAAVAGTTTISTWGGPGVAYTLSNNSGTADEARRMFIVATGTPGEAKNVICPAVSKMYVFRNDTTGGFALTLKTSGGTGIAVPAGQYKFLYCDGTNVVEAVNSLGPVASLTASQAVFTDASKNLVSNAITGTGNVVMSTSPTLVTPALGTPSALVGTNITGTAAGLTAGNVTTNANLTGAVTSVGNATSLGSFSSANLAGALTDETGTGSAVFATSPTLVTPILGTPTSVTLTNATGLPLSTGVTGTLATTNGGTGLTSFTSGGVVYASSTSALATGSALTYNGTALTSSASSAISGIFNRDTSSGATLQIQVVGNSVGTLGSDTGGNGRFDLAAVTSMQLRAAGASGYISFDANNTEQMRLTSTGLGIGTSSPGQKLSVNGDTLIGTNLFIGNGAGSMVGATAPSLYSPASGTLGISTAGVERMRLDSSGNLGIGTSSPATKLNVKGTDPIIRMATPDNSMDIGYITSGGPSAQRIRIGSAGGATDVGLTVLNSGNVGIGTSSPSNTMGPGLHIASASGNSLILEKPTGAAMQFRSDATTIRASISGINGADGLTFSTGAAQTERMRLDSSGNLGLGVTPSAWGGAKAFEAGLVGNYFIGSTAASYTSIGTASYYNGSNWVYARSTAASKYELLNNTHAWYTAPSGTAGNAISFTQAMTLDASGNLLVGGTAQSGTANRAAVFSANKFGLSIIDTTAQATGVGGALNLGGNYRSAGDAQAFCRVAAAKENSTDTNFAYAMTFATTPNGGTFTEGARISSDGTFRVKGAGTAGSTDAVQFSGSAPASAMVLDVSGNLLVGATAPYTAAFTGISVQGLTSGTGNLSLGLSKTGTPQILSGDVLGNIYFYGVDNNITAGNNNIGARIASIATTDWTTDGTTSNAALVFYTHGTTSGAPEERARISSDGTFRVKGAGTAGSTDAFQVSGSAPASAMVLNSSGNVGIGVTNPSVALVVAFATDGIIGNYFSSTGNNSRISFSNAGLLNNNVSIGSASDAMVMYTGATERARITSGGYFKASDAGTYQNASAAYHELRQTASDWIGYFVNTNATPYGIQFGHITDANSTGSPFFQCTAGAALGTLRAEIRSNGGLANYSANDVNLSDRREKTNFAPAKSYLDTICAIPVQTFNYIDQSEDDPGLTLGVVAQDVQAVAPELVMESNWGTEDEPKMRLSIYQTDLQYALMKCVQELKAELDSVKAELATLKGQP